MAYTPFKMKGPSLYKAPGKVNEGQPTVLPTVNVNAKKNELQTKLVLNEDGSYTETKTKGERSGSTTYKKTDRKNVYKNEQGQVRTITPKG